MGFDISSFVVVFSFEIHVNFVSHLELDVI